MHEILDKVEAILLKHLEGQFAYVPEIAETIVRIEELKFCMERDKADRAERLHTSGCKTTM